MIEKNLKLFALKAEIQVAPIATFLHPSAIGGRVLMTGIKAGLRKN